MENGKIVRADQPTPVDIHSAIAQVKKSSADRLNGWSYWMVMREDKLVLIDDIRQNYIREVKCDEIP